MTKDNRGGHRTPSHPAPVSGPGKLSKRTDGGPAQKMRDLTGGAYGEGEDFRALEASAPMAAEGGAPMGPPQGPPSGGPPADVVPFGAPSQNPDEPVTAGAPMGPGVGPESLGLQDPRSAIDQQDAQRQAEYLPVLEFVANQPGSSSAMRAYVRQIKALIS